jgi:hypothetical protein
MCAALVVEGGTASVNTNDASPPDVTEACLADEAAGKSAMEFLQRLIAGGALTTVLYLANEGQHAQDQQVAPPVPIPEDAPSGSRPDSPNPWSQAVQALAAALISANLDADLSTPQAEDIAARCLRLTNRAGINGYRKCRELPIFVTGSTTPEPTQHDFDAIFHKNPSWTLLHYEGGADTGKPGSGWYTGRDGCTAAEKPAEGRTECDEFPYFSTREGGPPNDLRAEPSLRWVDWLQNRSQGGSLSAFYYTKCDVGLPKGNERSDPFLVIPEQHVPTMSLCNGHRAP